MLDWFKKKFRGEEEETSKEEPIVDEAIIKDNDDEKHIEDEEVIITSDNDPIEDSYNSEEYDKSFNEIIKNNEVIEDDLETDLIDEKSEAKSEPEVIYDSDKSKNISIDYNEEEKFKEETSKPEVIKTPETTNKTAELNIDESKDLDNPFINEVSTDEKISESIIEEDKEVSDESTLIEEPEVEEEPEETGFFGKIFGGLKKTRDSITHTINDILGNYVQIDDDLFEELEEVLITSDIGAVTTMKLIDNLRDRIRKDGVKDPSKVMPLLADEARKLLENENAKSSFNIEKTPTVVLVVGVNGVGKTTTIGKLASKYKSEGKNVLLAAADTFRAAATEQLQEWAKRADVDIVYHEEGTDPGAVVFDAIDAAKSKNSDIILVDTAGRLHNKKNLMNELNKIYRIIEKNYPEANRETLIVLDATTGQNALSQAKEFNEVANISGIVLTKLDGTAKGGIAISLVDEYEIPVVYIGVGEKINDLQPFDPVAFANSIFGIE